MANWYFQSLKGNLAINMLKWFNSIKPCLDFYNSNILWSRSCNFSSFSHIIFKNISFSAILTPENWLFPIPREFSFRDSANLFHYRPLSYCFWSKTETLRFLKTSKAKTSYTISFCTSNILKMINFLFAVFFF